MEGMEPVQRLARAPGDTMTVSEDGAEAEQEEARERIELRTAGDLIELAEQCHADSFSENKDVVLMGDIQLANSDFTTIPIFCGHFDGNGYTISGYDYGGDGYVTGFFRYVGESAVIENLHLDGIIRAGGKQQVSGGLAGISSGTIQNCSFSGKIFGKSETGGIAGVNTADGEILKCTNNAAVSGYYFTGGIAGKNYGMLYGCENTGSLNDSVEWITEEDEMNSDILSELTDDDLTDVRKQSGTDTGGIAGYSRGAVISCTNEGDIGYEHAGYNIGGIVGRQTGLVSNCTNRGLVRGRKDIGGIAGQMEPYLEVSEEDSINADVNELHDMVNDLMDIMDTDNAVVKSDLEELRGYADNAVDTGDEMADQASEYVNQNVDVANDASGRLDHVLEMSPGVTDNLTQAGNSADSMADQFKRLNEDLYISGSISEDQRKELDGYSDTISNSSKDIQNAADRISGTASISPYENAGDGIVRPVGESDAVITMTAGSVVHTAPGATAYRISKEAYSSESSFPEDWSRLNGRITLEQGYYYYLPEETYLESYKVVYDGEDRSMAGDMTEPIGVAYTVVVKEPTDMADSVKAVGDAGRSAAEIGGAMSGLYKEYTDILKDATTDAHRDLEKALTDLDQAMESVNKAQTSLNEITDYLNAQDDLKMVKIDEEWNRNVDNVHEQMDNMSAVMQRLGDHAEEYTTDVNDQIRAINDQINEIYNDIYNKLNERVDGIREENFDYIYADISDADIEHATQGKVTGSTNYGVINGDVNVGGITGAMAIDEEDPEGNAAGTMQISLGGRYTSQNILYHCTNRGYVTAKNDGAGGIVGFVKNGVVSASCAYGAVESTEGSYVGGIAGQALSAIRDCYVLCALSGGENVGGVAGYGTTITGCYAMPTITETTGKSGAIAGQIEIDEDTQLPRLDQLSENYYVGENLYGIDRISYWSAAQEIGYRDLLKLPGTPLEFRYLTVTFRVGDEYLGAQRVNYGDACSTIELPAIPAREGFFGSWPELPEGTITGNMVITAEYADSVRVIESEGRDPETGRQLALIDNDFNDEARLSAQIVTEPPFHKAGYGEHICYEIKIMDSGKGINDIFSLRLYDPYSGRKVSVWQYNGTDWEEVETLDRGSYLQVNMHGLEGVYCIAAQDKETVTIAAAAGGGVVLILLLLLIGRRRRKKRRAKKQPA